MGDSIDINTDDTLKDYKIWCFNGEPKITLVCTDRYSNKGLHEDFFDMEWNHLPIRRPDHSIAEYSLQEPHHYKLMQELARKLSVNIPFVRVDFYETKRGVYFGEITFFPASGFEAFEPDELDVSIGRMIDLSFEKDHYV